MTGPDKTGLLLGIDFGGTKMALAVAGADGQVLAHDVLPTLPDLGAEASLDRALNRAAELARGLGELTAVGIATPGAVDGDRISLAPNVPGWDHLDLRRATRERLGVDRIAVWNDLNAAALAELRLGLLQQCDPGLVVGLGTGIAVAVTVDGAVVPGAHHAAGELGYARLGTGELTEEDPILESVFSGIALDRVGRDLGLVDAAGLTSSDCAGAGAAFTARLGELLRHLTSACLILDPQRIVLVGGMTASPRVVEGIRYGLEAYVPVPPEILVSQFPQQATLYGALQLAEDEARGRPAGAVRQVVRA